MAHLSALHSRLHKAPPEWRAHKEGGGSASSAVSNSGARGHLTAGAFVSWIVRVVVRRIVVAWIADRTGRNPLLQLFHVEQDLIFRLVFHGFFGFVVLPAFKVGSNEPAGALRFMHPCQPLIPAEPSTASARCGREPRAGTFLTGSRRSR